MQMQIQEESPHQPPCSMVIVDLTLCVVPEKWRQVPQVPWMDCSLLFLMFCFIFLVDALVLQGSICYRQQDATITMYFLCCTVVCYRRPYVPVCVLLVTFDNLLDILKGLMCNNKL